MASGACCCAAAGMVAMGQEAVESDVHAAVHVAVALVWSHRDSNPACIRVLLTSILVLFLVTIRN